MGRSLAPTTRVGPNCTTTIMKKDVTRIGHVFSKNPNGKTGTDNCNNRTVHCNDAIPMNVRELYDASPSTTMKVSRSYVPYENSPNPMYALLNYM